jgi:hypothetical protein
VKQQPMRSSITRSDLTRCRKGLKGFFTRPYWSRLWILQEVLVARKVVVLWGGGYIDWDILEAVAKEDVERAEEDKDDYDFHVDMHKETPGHKVIDARARFERKGLFTLEKIILDYGEKECSDVRDQIFGYLGLIDFGDKAPIQADYSLTLEQVQVSSRLSESTTLYYNNILEGNWA